MMGGSAMQRAEEYLARFEGVRALLAYEEALAVDARDGGAAAGRVQALWLLRRYRAARYHLREILASFPRWPDTHVTAGYVALGQRDDPIFLGVLDGSSHRDTNGARGAFDEALLRDSRCVPAWRGLAAAARLDGDLNGALGVLAKAEAEAGHEPRFLLERAMCARDGERLVDALAHVHQAVQLVPGSMEGQIIEARVLTELGRPREAVQVVDALARAGADCAPFFLTAALVYEQLALTIPDRPSRIGPRSIHDYCIRAACRDAACGPRVIETAITEAHLDAEVQIHALQTALEGAPHSPLLRVSLAKLYHSRGEGCSAAEQARLAGMADPTYVPARVAQAQALVKVGSVSEATALMKDLVDRYPQLALVQNLVQDIEHQNGQFEAALGHAIVARQSAPDDLESRRRVVQELVSLGDVVAAEEELRAGIEQWPGDPDLRAWDARSALTECRRHEALSRLKRARSAADQSTCIDQLFSSTRRWLMLHPLSWWGGGGIDIEAMKRLEATATNPDRGRDHIPDAGRRRVTGLLRQLDWDAARSYTLARQIGEIITSLLLFGAFYLAYRFLPNWILELGTLKSYTWTWTGWDVLIIVPTAVLLLTRGIRTRLSAACAAAIATAIYIAMARNLHQWKYARSSNLLSDVLIDLTTITFVITAASLLVRMLDLIKRRWERRALHRRPIAAMISSLLELSALLTKDLLTDRRARTRCMQLIEDTARAQEHALSEALGDGVGHADPAIADRTLRWAARTAAATRQLKEQIVASNAATANSLREKVENLLGIACQQCWGELEQADRPPRRQRALGWLGLAARTLVIAAIPIVALGIYEIWIRPHNSKSLPEPSAWTTIVVGVIWPVTTILWRLDPDISGKLGAITKVFGGPTATGSGNRGDPAGH
jgi:predicted Zn-dependent protease